MHARVVVVTAYVSVLGVLALFACHRLYLLLLLVWNRKKRTETPPAASLPRVTVQIPVWNELGVIERALDGAAALDYPRELLEIQVLDDSTDETSALIERKAEELRRSGLAVTHVRRGERAGFKAGALANGLPACQGALVLILDADFVPAPELLQRAVPHFQDAKVGLVQVRWDHANRNASLLTRVQALLLDAHFLVEQAARSRSGRPFKFNGTGGVWRRSAIEDAGGWSWDTLTEDLDLSVRAQLRGWRFVFLDDVAATGELPEDLAAFRSQQSRWVKGSAETARKLLGDVWRTPGVPLGARLETTVQLLLNAAYPFALALALLTVPLVGLGVPRAARGIADLHAALFFLATFNVGAFLVASQARRGLRGILEAVLLLPLVFALGLGLSLSNARAFLAGLLRRSSPFVRTPKRGTLAKSPYLASAPLGEALLELLLTLYLSWGGALAIYSHRPWALPFQTLLVLGFLACGIKALTASVNSKFRVTRSLS